MFDFTSYVYNLGIYIPWWWMKRFNVSQRSLIAVTFWLLTNQTLSFHSGIHFLSDNKNHRKNPPLLSLLRIEKEKKEICEMLFWYMFGFAEGLRSTGKIYKFYFYFIYEAFSAEHFLSFHPLISDLFPQGILTPNSSENTRNNISNLNITHETKQQKRILRSTNIGISHIHVECQMGRYERESSI